MLGFTDAQLEKYSEKLIKVTGHSPEQINYFFDLLKIRMRESFITSFEDLYVRYESIYSSKFSERKELLVEVVGFFHLNSLHTLLNLIEKERESFDMIKIINEKLKAEEDLRKTLKLDSEEYRESLKNEVDLLERKQYHLKLLAE